MIFSPVKSKLAVKLDKSSVIRQKGESQDGGNKKTKQAKFSENRTFLKGVRNIRFSENLACFVFLIPPVNNAYGKQRKENRFILQRTRVFRNQSNI